MQKSLRTLAVVAVAMCAAVMAAVVAAPAASAQSGSGNIDLVLVKALSDGSSAQVTVKVKGPDGAPAAGATVTMVGQPSGLSGNAGLTKSYTLVPGAAPGEYTGFITLPGEGNWKVRVTSVSPAGTVEFEQSSSGAITTTQAPPTTSADSAGDASAANGKDGKGGDASAANGKDGKGGDASAANGKDGNGGDASAVNGKDGAAAGDSSTTSTGGGSLPWLWILAGVVAAGVVALAVFSRARTGGNSPRDSDAPKN